VKPPPPPREKDLTRARVSLLASVVLLLFVALFSRLWYLQVLAGDRYGQLAEGNRVRQVVIDAPRGRILDRKGKVIVDNRGARAVTVKVRDMGGQKDVVMDRLARLLGVPRAQLDERLEGYVGSPLRGVPVAEDVQPEVLFYLTEHAAQFPGVEPAVVPLRRYPHGALAAHVLGYVAEISGEQLNEERYRAYRQGDLIGKAGVEMTYDRDIRGRDGYQLLEVNASGKAVRTLANQEPVQGNDLQLTIDLDVQKAAETALAEGMAKARTYHDKERGTTYPATAAAAVVLDVRDGALLALASLPQYDPRRFVGGIKRSDFAAYQSAKGKPLINRAVQSVYPPGSTWKSFVAMAGLTSGTITPSTRFSCGGSFRLGNYVKRDWKPSGHGSVDLNKSLEQSCDVYYYTVGNLFWRQEEGNLSRHRPAGEKMQAMARQFGFDRQPELDLPFAADGTIPDRSWRREFWTANKDMYCKGTSRLYRELCAEGWRWRGGDNLNIAIGQGDIQVSPLQLARGYAALGNGGTVYSPRVGDRVLDAATRAPVRAVAPKVASVVKAPPRVFSAVGDALALVPVSGTAVSAFSGFPLDRYPIAGKTGTADLPPYAPFAWFASFAPASKPKYAVVVMVEQGGHGGQTAGPIARKIYESLFGVAPSELKLAQDGSG
jgi:penicillin-binding protein 2